MLTRAPKTSPHLRMIVPLPWNSTAASRTFQRAPFLPVHPRSPWFLPRRTRIHSGAQAAMVAVPPTYLARIVTLALLAVGGLWLGGCSADPTQGYSFYAHSHDETVRTVSVPMFQNPTFTRGIEVELTDAIIKVGQDALARDDRRIGQHHALGHADLAIPASAASRSGAAPATRGKSPSSSPSTLTGRTPEPARPSSEVVGVSRPPGFHSGQPGQ